MRPPRQLNPRAQDGLTLIEVIIAAFVLAVGILGFMYNFDGARKLTLASERQTSAAHRAQQEVERLQSVPYSELAMSSAPTHVGETCSSTSNPDACVSSGSEPTYQYDPSQGAKKPKLVIATGGAVSPTPIAWTGEHTTGFIYEFVSWESDTTCGTKCEAAGGQNYKRITVVVTVTVPSGTHAVSPIRVSTLIADPNAGGANANPLVSPTTRCGPSKESCTNGVAVGKPEQYFLYDYPESGTAPTASHALHATVAPSGSGCTSSTTTAACPTPDLMDTTSPGESALYDYSNDQDSLGATNGESGHGGRVLMSTNTACSATASSSIPENTKGELWVTKPLSVAKKLTGVGALSIYTQTLNGQATPVTLCLGIYNVPNSLSNLVESPPTLIGYGEYTPDAWPQSLGNLSFLFEKLNGAGSLSITSGHRIGMRLWTAAGNIGIAYDTVAQRSILQLNTE
jgi:type II secretory pathway pseudopilin PulG